jgi:hypothetical protein
VYEETRTGGILGTRPGRPASGAWKPPWNPAVFLVFGAYLDAVALGDLERDLERVDRVEAKALAEQRGIGIDLFRRHVFEVQGRNDQFGKLAFCGTVLESGHCFDFSRMAARIRDCPSSISCPLVNRLESRALTAGPWTR